MTKVINILAGSGCGKSTTASGLFYEMKKLGLEVELVREYVKTWAWTGKKVGEFDQLYLLAKQAKSEYDLYGKVNYIVTDSPLYLSAIYEQHYSKAPYLEDTVMGYLSKARKFGVEHINFVLNRTKPYNPHGRFETEAQAKEVDGKVRAFLVNRNIPFYEVTKEHQDDKVREILEYVLEGK